MSLFCCCRPIVDEKCIQQLRNTVEGTVVNGILYNCFFHFPINMTTVLRYSTCHDWRGRKSEKKALSSLLFLCFENQRSLIIATLIDHSLSYPQVLIVFSLLHFARSLSAPSPDHSILNVLLLLTIHMTKRVTLPLRAIGPVHPSSALVFILRVSTLVDRLPTMAIGILIVQNNR